VAGDIEAQASKHSRLVAGTIRPGRKGKPRQAKRYWTSEILEPLRHREVTGDQAQRRGSDPLFQISEMDTQAAA